MRLSIRIIGQVLAFATVLSGLNACSPPQDVADVKQVIKGVNDPQSTFAVQFVTRNTLSMIAEWPDSHPAANRQWISHQQTPPDPQIKTGDKLSLAVWDNDDSSLLSSPGQKVIQLPDLRVSSAGTIFMPYIDEVYVARMTPSEARKAIQAKLLAIIPSAQVQLNFASGSQNSVQVISGLPNPGTVPLADRNTTLTTVLAQSGGIPVAMVNPQVNLQRDGKLYRVGADTLLNHPEMDTTLRGGDKIFVQPDERYFLSLGAAGREAMINFPRNNITTLDAMSLVGGLDAGTADPKGILVLRDYPQSAVRSDTKRGPPKNRMIFSFNLTTADGLFSAGAFPIEDRDLVLVTQSPLVNARTVLNFVTGFMGAGRNFYNTANSGN
ncbi:MAG: polysaccharide biosynthesis/export family protein [Cypionkella sp.]